MPLMGRAVLALVLERLASPAVLPLETSPSER